MKITTLGIDLAKNVFQLHGVDERARAVLRKRLSRGKLMGFLANLEPCLIGIEACAGAHYWTREMGKLGHTVRIMSPQYVKPYIKSNKNDSNDAQGICEAVGRPHMHFVPPKSVEQQDIQALHRAREQLIKGRTALANQTRGLLAEYGIVVSKGVHKLRAALPRILEDGENGLSPLARITALGVGGVKPQLTGIGPIVSTKKALAQAGISADQVDRVEFNEAFASPAWESSYR